MAVARGTGAASIITGLIVAVAAIIPLVWVLSPGTTATQVDADLGVVDVSTTHPVSGPVVETIVVTPDPVEVDGLPESIVRALEQTGNLREEGPGELTLPASIVAVLADHDVVLRVAEDSAP